MNVNKPLGVYVGKALILGIQIAKGMELDSTKTFTELRLSEEEMNKIGKAHAFVIL